MECGCVLVNGKDWIELLYQRKEHHKLHRSQVDKGMAHRCKQTICIWELPVPVPHPFN